MVHAPSKVSSELRKFGVLTSQKNAFRLLSSKNITKPKFVFFRKHFWSEKISVPKLLKGETL